MVVANARVHLFLALTDGLVAGQGGVSHLEQPLPANTRLNRKLNRLKSQTFLTQSEPVHETLGTQTRLRLGFQLLSFNSQILHDQALVDEDVEDSDELFLSQLLLH